MLLKHNIIYYYIILLLVLQHLYETFIIFLEPIYITFYFYNLYDLKNITVRDKDGNVLDKDSIAGVDMINIESEFVSNYDDTELCVAAAIYGVDGVMHAVDFTETRVSAGKTSTAETEMVLSNKVQSGDKIKLFVFKNAELMTPLTSPRVVKVK